MAAACRRTVVARKLFAPDDETGGIDLQGDPPFGQSASSSSIMACRVEADVRLDMAQGSIQMADHIAHRCGSPHQ